MKNIAARNTLMAAGLVILVCGAGLCGHHVRSRYQCGIPKRNYQYKSQSATKVAISKTAIPQTPRPQSEDPNLPPRGDIKTFQLAERTIKLNQCSLSNVAVMLQKDGWMTLSFRADQNPRPSTAPGSAIESVESTETLTSFIKRNEFFVSIRGNGDFSVDEPDPAKTPGKPVLFQHSVKPFWVQREKPYFFFRRIKLPAAKEYYDLIDRIEVEFYYR